MGIEAMKKGVPSGLGSTVPSTAQTPPPSASNTTPTMWSGKPLATSDTGPSRGNQAAEVSPADPQTIIATTETPKLPKEYRVEERARFQSRWARSLPELALVGAGAGGGLAVAYSMGAEAGAGILLLGVLGAIAKSFTRGDGAAKQREKFAAQMTKVIEQNPDDLEARVARAEALFHVYGDAKHFYVSGFAGRRPTPSEAYRDLGMIVNGEVEGYTPVGIRAHQLVDNMDARTRAEFRRHLRDVGFACG